MQASLKDILAIAIRIVIGLLRTKRSIIFWAAFPALMPLLFGLIHSPSNVSEDERL